LASIVNSAGEKPGITLSASRRTLILFPSTDGVPPPIYTVGISLTAKYSVWYFISSISAFKNASIRISSSFAITE
jgi:hypothetical protein